MGKQMEQRATNGYLPIILTLAGFFLVLAIAAFFWIDRQPDPVAAGGRSPEERLEILREQRERDRQILEEYDWIERDAGVVRLPIDRAMELYLEEVNQGQTAPGSDEGSQN